MVKQISENEIYLLIKCIKSVLWRIAKRLSYIEDARCLNVNRLIFGDESTFHLSGKVNKHDVSIWGTENPRELVQYVLDSPKVNVFCAVSCTKVYGPFFPHENTVTGIKYLDMVSEWLLPQMQQDSENFIFIQDGAPPQ